MSTNDDRESKPEDHALGTGAHGDLENPAQGLSTPTVVTPVASEPVNAPAPAATPESVPVSRAEGAK